jgi:hypothetical protein
MGIFECHDMRIVNGAQTVGTIHSMLRRHADNLERTKVWVRLISLQGGTQDLGKTITRTNNTQNRIEKRDFVSLDHEQKRIHDELNLEEVVYLYKAGETRDIDEEGFDLTEATVARACIQEEIQYAVQAKREIGKLWDDIEKPPYKVLFNASIQGPQLWRIVQILRIVERFVNTKKRELSGRDKLMITHGNRFLLHLIYHNTEPESLSPDNVLNEQRILELCSINFQKLSAKVNELYPESVLGSLFKNLSKCRNIKENLEV